MVNDLQPGLNDPETGPAGPVFRWCCLWNCFSGLTESATVLIDPANAAETGKFYPSPLF